MNRWPLPMLLLLTVLAYTGVWSAGFVWDDVPLIVQNKALEDGLTLSVFTGDLWADSGAGEVASGYYRPLVLLSFALDRVFFGLSPAGYHLHSLLWHCAAVWGLWRLLLPMVGQRGAMLGAALFALHPVQSEVVVWISARNDLMAAAFGFAALNCVWRDEVPSRRRAVLAFLLTVAAAMSKETAFVLPLMAGLALANQTHRLARVGPLLVGVAVVIALRMVVGVGGSVAPETDGWILLFESAPQLAGLLGASVLSPWPISSARDLSWIDGTPVWRVVLGWGFIVMLVLAWYRATHRRLIGIGLGWSLLLVGVTWVAIADKGGFVDRFLYWPMAGLSVVLGAVAGQHVRWLLPSIAIPAVLLVQLRLPDWTDDLRLWGASIRDVASPTNELSLGHAMTLEGRHIRAHVAFTGALAGQQMDLEACSGVVGSAMRAGMSQQALRMGLWSEAKGCPPSGPRHGWMSTAAAMEGRWSLVEDWCSREPADQYGRDLIACAALAKRRADDEMYAAFDSRWEGQGSFAERVDALLTQDESPVKGGL